MSNRLTEREKQLIGYGENVEEVYVHLQERLKKEKAKGEDECAHMTKMQMQVLEIIMGTWELNKTWEE